ncbi:MAG: hypothetical protein ABR572_08050 [Cryomorphaceae bacterium]
MNRLSSFACLVVLCIFCGSKMQAQVFDFGASYAMNVPLGEMGQSMDNIHSFHFEGTAQFDRMPVAIGLGFQLGRYDRHKSDIDFEIEENAFIRAPLIVNHRYTMISIPVRYTFLPPGPVVPYAIVRASLGLFSSNAQVRDPDVDQGTEGIVNLFEENLHSYGTFVLTAGVGARLDLADIFGRFNHNRFFIDVEVAYLAGGPTSFAFSAREGSTRSGEGVDPEEAGYELIDHGYHTTEKFTERLSMLSLRVGAVYRFDVAAGR